MKGVNMEKLYTLNEVAELLSYSTQTIRRMIKSGKLKVVKFNKRVYRIEEREIKRFLKSLT